MVPSHVRKPTLLLVALLLAVLSVAPVAAYHEGDDATHEFASEHFYDRWARTDLPVEQGIVERTWMWGPEPYTEGMFEPYADSPGGERLVQYFDKSRMEINHPDQPADNLWFVTNGLLVVEMVDGRIQVGDEEFEDSQPAEVPIAGDPDDQFGPTYADINDYGLRGEPATTIGTTLDMTVQNGNVVSDDAFADYGVTAAYRVTVPGIDHTVASVFWDFMNSSGIVFEDEEYVEDNLFENPFYATGYPITEAYWANVLVGGTERDVLWQCFERRCLTYTPGNPEGFLVEAGNVGQHYYRWRHGDAQPVTETVNIHLVALEDNGESGMLIGCGDSLIPVEREIQATDDVELKITRTLNILLGLDDEFYGESGLYNALYQSDLSVDDVTVEDGTATVNLSGELLIGGVCDEPRVEEQLRQTILQFEGIDEAVILLNGGPLFPTPETETVNIYLVELGDDTEPVEDPEDGVFGCGDMLVPVEVEIAAQEDTEGRIAAALNALFAYEDDTLYNVFAGLDLTVADVQLINGVATVNISGEFSVGGVCDEPRVIEQVSATASQFEGVERVVVLVNGAAPFPSQQLGELEGGILATFAVSGEQFNVWVTNEDTIADILALEADPELGTFPNGPILAGPGEANHNLPWSWHLDPDLTEMAEVTIEVCDGRPSYVEGEVEEFINTVGSYCPWSAELVDVVDYRTPPEM